MSHQERLNEIANGTRDLAGAVALIERSVRSGTITQADTAELLGQLALDIDRAAAAIQVGAEIARAYAELRTAFAELRTAFDRLQAACDHLALLAQGQAPARRADFDEIEPKEDAA